MQPADNGVSPHRRERNRATKRANEERREREMQKSEREKLNLRKIDARDVRHTTCKAMHISLAHSSKVYHPP